MKPRNGVYLRVVNYDNIFRRLSNRVILMNEFDMDLESERNRLNSLIYASLDGDSLNNTASCDCGAKTGMDKYGLTCSECLSQVMPITEKPLESRLWLKVPAGISRFFNLTIWRILNKNLTHSGFNILEYLCDVRYQPEGRLPAEKQRKLDALEIPRGYNNFVMHYEPIIVALFKANLFGSSASARKRKKIIRFLQANIDNTFSEYMPFPTRLGFIRESSNSRVQVDPKMTTALNAAYILIGIDNREASEGQPSLPHHVKEARMVRAHQSMCEYYRQFEGDVLFRKPGVARKLVYGGRPDWGFRAVITSRQKPHKQNAIELPWSLSVLLFKSHIDNKLLKKNYTPNECRALEYENTLNWHPELDRIFKELLAESPGGTIPTTFGRNPTLTRGSIGFNAIDNIKVDPTDNTIGIGPLNLIDKNADHHPYQ